MPQTFLPFLLISHTYMHARTHEFQFPTGGKAAPLTRNVPIHNLPSMTVNQCWVYLSRGAPLTHHGTSAYLQGTYAHSHPHPHNPCPHRSRSPYRMYIPSLASPKASAHAPPRTRINKVGLPKALTPLPLWGEETM
jgi:hypothetical protein